MQSPALPRWTPAPGFLLTPDEGEAMRPSMCSHSIVTARPAPRAAILIAEDHPIITLGLRTLLEPEFHIAGEVHHGRDIIPAVRELQPDVVLLDLALPDLSAADVLRELAARPEPPGVVALATRDDRALAEHLLSLGARAIIPRDASLAELRHGIATARAGGRFLSPALERRTDPGRSCLSSPYECLTSREQQVVQLIGLGLTTGRMAMQLRVSYRTVHFHRTNIRRKLGFRTEWEMTRFALEVRQGGAGA